jgi:hypothetical protein
MGASRQYLAERAGAESRRGAIVCPRFLSHASAKSLDNARRHFGQGAGLRDFATRTALNSNDDLIGHWGG